MMAIYRTCMAHMPLALRLVMLSLVPAFIATLSVMAVLGQHHISELTTLTRNNALAVARQVAAVAREPLMQLDRRALAGAARMAAQQAGVEQVQIRTEDGEIVAQAGRWNKPGDVPGLQVIEPVDSVEQRQAGEVMVEFDMASVDVARRNLWATVIALLGASLLGVGLTGWWAARRISLPIRKLAEAVDALGAGQDVAVTEDATAEVGRLQRGFNVAARALTDSRRSMQTQIAEATGALAQKNLQLEAASQAKTRLLAAASHDLRQPLHALTLFSDALHTGETDPVRLTRIENIQECVSSLDRLFSELLNLSQIDAGVVRPQFSAFPLDRLFDEISRNFRAVAEQQELRLVVRKTDAWVYCDYVMLSRILNNLISNALRHTTVGGVLLGARSDAGGVRIEVRDTGIGIALEFQDKVFEEFYQVDAPTARGARGLGLGLATVKRLCELLGMPVLLRSRPGRGTLVAIVAARGEPALLPPAPVAAVDVVDFNGLTIVVVDDEPHILEGLALVFRSWGATVLAAETRAQVMALADGWTQQVPDIVVSDLLLRNGENGLEVLRELDAHPNLRGKRIAHLLVTGETKPDRLREIADARIAVLHKPVGSAALRQAIAAAVARNRQPTT